METKIVSGMLRLTLVDATLTHSTEFFAKMDPYVTITVAGFRVKSKVIKKGGKHPVWNETMDIKIRDIDEVIQIHVLDLDMTKSDLIGLHEVQAAKLIVNNGVDTKLDLTYHKKPAGLLHIKT